MGGGGKSHIYPLIVPRLLIFLNYTQNPKDVQFHRGQKNQHVFTYEKLQPEMSLKNTKPLFKIRIVNYLMTE